MFRLYKDAYDETVPSSPSARTELPSNPELTAELEIAKQQAELAKLEALLAREESALGRTVLAAMPPAR